MLTASLASELADAQVSRIAPDRPSSEPTARTLPRGLFVVVSAVVALAAAVGVAKVLLDEQPSGTSLAAYDAAVRSAVETLAASDGVEGAQSGYVEGNLVGAVWFDSRSNGDVVVVQRQDAAVGDYGWPGDPSTGPTAEARVITTTIWVRVDDRQYEATLTNGQSDDGWSVTEANDGWGDPLALGLVLLFQYDEFATPTDVGEVSFEESAEGGGVWTLTAPFSDGNQITTWQIGGAGELVSWSYELVGVSSSNLEFPGLTSGAVRFTSLTDPDPILVPDLQAMPDPAQFGLPGDFPLGSG
jgi:hypothetical protein